MYPVEPGGTGGFLVAQDAIKPGELITLEAFVDGVAVASVVCKAAYTAGDQEAEMHMAILSGTAGYSIQCGAGTQLP
jgi:hypothetical protein